ncbi:hypothetical protein [Bradyrhizobium diazoefficiens]|uniref:hypothetical protein n=1 Tax=Bradyrhizobium diazoefficiens TaxID=1355477 RepID=UPI002729F400|nr:hypothetical protein [Bradyrhizobium diazoefficiens]WLA63712.1 hypothetical protein QNN01_35880 [Bradyrhizobium diazoefficiens]
MSTLAISASDFSILSATAISRCASLMPGSIALICESSSRASLICSRMLSLPTSSPKFSSRISLTHARGELWLILGDAA